MLEGITGSPYKTPNVRKTIPKAYSRPSVSVGGGTGPRFVKRSWRDVKVTEVKEYDTVAEFGIVAEVEEVINIPQTIDLRDIPDRPFWTVRLHNVMGETKDYPGHDRVFAFTADPE